MHPIAYALDIHVKFSDRETHFEKFFEWLHENDVSTDSVKIVNYDEGHGLQATKDIKVKTNKHISAFITLMEQ